ncbi:MAG: AMP-binding protein [Alphaproteobacteria bacterium]|jgi:long-chain acyl-CoA synthetase|nr:AMP-binding protein [Alphaproteobacteria bacterium]
MSSLYAYETIIQLLKKAADEAPHAAAIQDAERQLTYAELWAAITHSAAGLQALAGVTGGRVALIAENSLDCAVAFHAVHAAGAQIVPINPAYTPRELREILTDADPALVLFDAGRAEQTRPLLEEMELAGLPIGAEARPWADWLERGGPTALASWPRPDDLASLQYTGGTTGRPKGVNITHRQLVINLLQREAALPTYAEDIVLCVMPLFHVFATAMCLYLAANCRGLLLIQRRYHPEQTLKMIAQNRVTCLPAGPTLIAGLMGHADFSTTDLSSLRAVYSGSAALPVTVLERWEAAVGCPIFEGYGQSEAGPVLSYHYAAEQRIPGTVGRALPETEIEIVDVETGQTILPTGESGEIRARGPQIMSGYRNRPEETGQALRDGWLYTGDIGVLDENRVLTIKDRKKDMVISSGYNIYPREVEEVLLQHEAVAEAAVIGVPDAYRGEVLRAFLVARSGRVLDSTALEAFCRQQLASYKVPARFQLLEALPRTQVGKIDKPALKKLVSDS